MRASLIRQRIRWSCLFASPPPVGRAPARFVSLMRCCKDRMAVRSNFMPSASQYNENCESVELIIEWSRRIKTATTAKLTECDSSWLGLVTKTTFVLNTELFWYQRNPKERKGRKKTEKSYLYHSSPQKLKPNINKLELKKKKKSTQLIHENKHLLFD